MSHHHRIVPVILAGGIGRRLRPLSREKQPKPFMKLPGQRLTMLQQTAQRLIDFAPPLIMCGQAHRPLAMQQMQQIGVKPSAILLEPVSRNTAPAIAAAATYINGAYGTGKKLMLVVPSDHAIADPQPAITAIGTAAATADAGHIVIFGVEPKKAETRYGYIRGGAPIDGAIFEIKQFEEKPPKNRARDFLQQGGYYWNSGMVLCDPALCLSEIESLAPDIAAQATESVLRATRYRDTVSLKPEAFSACPALSFDVAVLEKTEKAVMMALDMPGWRDLGTWPALLGHLLSREALAA